MDCGDYANEATGREISVLLVVLAAVKACPENTQHGHATAGTRTLVREAVVGTLT